MDFSPALDCLSSSELGWNCRTDEHDILNAPGDFLPPGALNCHRFFAIEILSIDRQTAGNYKTSIPLEESQVSFFGLSAPERLSIRK